MPIMLELGEIEADARRAAQSAGMELPDFLREAVAAKIRENNFAVARSFESWTDGELIAEIKIGFPGGFRQRYRELRRRRSDAILTDSERDELLRCSERVTRRDAQRLPLLLELASRHKTDVPTLINDLQLRRHVA